MNQCSLADLTSEKNVFYRCVEDSNEAIMITDVQGVLFYVNKAWQRIYGYSLEEAVGNTPRMLRSRYQTEEFYREMWRQILDPKKGYWRGELVNRAKDGAEVPVLLTITPYRNSGVTEGYMGIAVDMTHQKEMEAQIIRQDRLASVGLLASGLAHEVGTPLGVIRGRAEYLSFLAGENAKLKEGLEVIVQQIDRISKLIYSLLHLARADRSETARPIIAADAFRQVAILTEQKRRQLGITLDVEISDNVRVVAENDRLTQVALNLTMNSIHAIEAAAQRDPGREKRILVSAEEHGNSWEILFSDTGTGISEENLKNLFKPFFTTKDVGAGTGLGLVISLQIVQSWGGNMTVSSAEGKGTTFKILLPKAKKA